MLRRRRSLPGGSDGEMNSSQNEPIKRDKDEAERMKKERMAKLKMSPFPEDRGYILPLKETQRLNQLSDLKMSLAFTGVETASPAFKTSMADLVPPASKSDNEKGCYLSESHLAAGLKPSDVVELQKHVSPTVAKQQRNNGRISDVASIGVSQGQADGCGPSEGEQPSASIKNMWDNVVSWMKTAVDFIAFENPEDANTLSPIGKKRLLTESGSAHLEDTPVATKRARNMSREENSDESAGGKGHRGSLSRQRRKSGRRMSFGGLRRAAAGASGDGGLGELLKLEPIKEASHSPPNLKNTTKPTTSADPPPPTTHNPSMSSQKPGEPVTRKTDTVPREKEDITARGARDTFKSPTGILASDLDRNLAIKSPLQPAPKLTALPRHMVVAQLGSKVVRCKGNSLLTSTAMRFQSGYDGLNSILDGSPDPIPGVEAVGVLKKKKRIRRQSLCQFYGNSVNSPNLTEVPRAVIKVRRSPRLAEKEHGPPSMSSTPATETDSTGIPLPPPPPPIPFALSKSKSSLAPQTSFIPPPPPPPNSDGILELTHDSEHSDVSTLSDCRAPEAINHSRVMLQKMQSRLRKKMKKKGGVSGGQGAESRSVEAKNNGKIDIRVSQWAEIQAYSRKMSLTEFLSLAEQKKTELQTALERLESSCPLGSLEEVSAVVELLQESSQWFPGGSKQMKDTLPLYKTLERKIEVLTEFVQVSGEMQRCSLINHPVADVNHSNLSTALSHIREEFESKHRHWSTVLTSNAGSWSDLNLPVCHALLLRSRHYLCSLVMRFAQLVLSEASKMTGILVSIKCVRTTQVKEKFKECLQLMHTALPYFPQAPPTSLAVVAKCSCQHCPASREEDREHSSSDYSQDSLLRSATQVALSYITVAHEQFNSFVCQASRQEVCEHFEGILKIISLLKLLVSSASGVGSNQLRTTGILALLPPGAEELGSAIHSSCVELIQHIVNQANPFLSSLSPHSKERKSKEIMLWMMFGCKYVNQTLEALGSDHADQGGMMELLNDLQQMECLLPD